MPESAAGTADEGGEASDSKARPAESLLRRRGFSLWIQRCVSFAEEMKISLYQPIEPIYKARPRPFWRDVTIWARCAPIGHYVIHSLSIGCCICCKSSQ